MGRASSAATTPLHRPVDRARLVAVPAIEPDEPVVSSPPATPTVERRAARRVSVERLGIVLQIDARRRLRRIWRPGVSASVAILDIATPPRGPLRLTGRDLRTGFIVVMDVDRATDRVTVVGLRAPGARKMRRVRWRFRASGPGLVPQSVHRASRFGAPLPGQGPWPLPRRVAEEQPTPDPTPAPPPAPRAVGGPIGPARHRCSRPRSCARGSRGRGAPRFR